MKYKTKLTRKQENVIVERAKDHKATNVEIVRRAGYSPITAQKKASSIVNDERIAKRISELVDTGLDALEDVAKNDRNGIARAAAGKTLVETGLGKPKDNKSTTFGDITINVAKIDPTTLERLAAQTN